MATFKAGQRVRKIAERGDPLLPFHVRVPLGTEGTVVGYHALLVMVRFDGFLPNHGLASTWARNDCFYCSPHQLAPRVDPAADAFIARIQKLGREPSPVVQPMTERIEK